MSRTTLIGIAGGTGSGKTTLAQKIRESFPKGEVVIISQDSHYLDQGHLPLEERRRINYDHPLAFDFPQKILIELKPVIILESILVLEEEEIRNLLDIKIFVDCDPDVRFIRRLLADIIIPEGGFNKVALELIIAKIKNILGESHVEGIETKKIHSFNF